jgi:ABC-2 type transport system permease protein
MSALTSAEVIRVRVPPRSWRSELRAIKIVWQRELIRFASDRMRIVTSLVQPLLFLFVLGSGLQQLSRASTHGVDLTTFIYPGILCIAVMFTAMFSAASIVWDREFGFLREMMVAPVRRSSIVIGKCIGGATVAAFQGVILICLAGAVGVPYDPLLILGIFGLQLLLAFSITAFGVMVAARITQMQSFMGVMQMVVMPMFFISGALYPVSGLPGWLSVLNRLDPLTYAVDPMRRLIFNHLDITPAARRALDPGVTWWGWHVPSGLEALAVLVLGLALMGVAIWGSAPGSDHRSQRGGRRARNAATPSAKSPARMPARRAAASWSSVSSEGPACSSRSARALARTDSGDWVSTSRAADSAAGSRSSGATTSAMTPSACARRASMWRPSTNSSATTAPGSPARRRARPPGE